jgi:hypothetical protein
MEELLYTDKSKKGRLIHAPPKLKKSRPTAKPTFWSYEK